MEKKESPKPKAKTNLKPSAAPHKMSGLSAKTFGIIKFILGILLLPFVYSSSVAFVREFGMMENNLQAWFWSGLVTFLIIYLFIWEPAIIYAKGHRLLEIVFSFFQPFVRVTPYLLPIYTIVIFIIYGFLSITIRSYWLTQCLIFLAGFSIILHLVFSAKSVRTKKDDFLKGDYIFGFSFIYIVNLLLLALCLNLVFNEFSFVDFVNATFQAAKNIFDSTFNQLFVAK